MPESHGREIREEDTVKCKTDDRKEDFKNMPFPLTVCSAVGGIFGSLQLTVRENTFREKSKYKNRPDLKIGFRPVLLIFLDQF